MSTIVENIQRRIANLTGKDVEIGLAVASAVAAIRKGAGTDEWEAFMRPYATDEKGVVNADQLARLMGNDGTLGDLTLDRKRSYILANCICGDTTLPTTDYGVDSIEDLVGTHRCDRMKSPCMQSAAKKGGRKKGGKKKAGKKAGKKPGGYAKKAANR